MFCFTLGVSLSEMIVPWDCGIFIVKVCYIYLLFSAFLNSIFELFRNCVRKLFLFPEVKVVIFWYIIDCIVDGCISKIILYAIHTKIKTSYNFVKKIILSIHTVVRLVLAKLLFRTSLNKTTSRVSFKLILIKKNKNDA